PVGLVVERDVARDDRHAELLGRARDALDRLRELPGDFGLLGIAEVEAVREADGLAAGARHVEGGAVDGASAREIGVARAGRWPVERDGEAPQRRSQPQDGRVQARAAYGARADEVVVLLEYPSLRLVVCRVDPRAAAPARCDALDLVAR